MQLILWAAGQGWLCHSIRVIEEVGSFAIFAFSHAVSRAAQVVMGG